MTTQEIKKAALDHFTVLMFKYPEIRTQFHIMRSDYQFNHVSPEDARKKIERSQWITRQLTSLCKTSIAGSGFDLEENQEKIYRREIVAHLMRVYDDICKSYPVPHLDSGQMKQVYSLIESQDDNFHVLTVQYIPSGNYHGAKVKITSDRFKKSKTLPYDHEFRDCGEIAKDYLKKQGFQIIGKGEKKDGYFIISTTFKSL